MSSNLVEKLAAQRNIDEIRKKIKAIDGNKSDLLGISKQTD